MGALNRLRELENRRPEFLAEPRLIRYLTICCLTCSVLLESSWHRVVQHMVVTQFYSAELMSVLSHMVASWAHAELRPMAMTGSTDAKTGWEWGRDSVTPVQMASAPLVLATVAKARAWASSNFWVSIMMAKVVGCGTASRSNTISAMSSS